MSSDSLKKRLHQAWNDALVEHKSTISEARARIVELERAVSFAEGQRKHAEYKLSSEASRAEIERGINERYAKRIEQLENLLWNLRFDLRQEGYHSCAVQDIERALGMREPLEEFE